MDKYALPLRDIDFLLRHVFDGAQVLEKIGSPVDLDTCIAIVEQAGKFAAGVLDPINRTGDRQGVRWDAEGVVTAEGFAEAYRAYCDQGWNGLKSPEEYGGQGLPQFVSSAVEEACHCANMSFTLCPMLTQAAIEALTVAGSEGLKSRYLPKLISGEWTGTMNLTEAQAGSDLAAIKTRAIADGDRWRIHGQKIFITYGEHDMADNIIHLVLARTADSPPGVKGISLFLVPKFLGEPDQPLGRRNDVRCVSVEHKLGIHASPTAVMLFGEREGAVGFLVGQENRGIEYMFIMMNLARYAVGLQGLAIAERAYQHARGYAQERVQGRVIGEDGALGLTIMRHPDVRRMLLSMRSKIEAMRALALYTGIQFDLAGGSSEAAAAQARVDFLIPIVKGWLTECAQHVASDALQVFGGAGFVEESGAAQYYRDARITTIYEGTTGIQANDLLGRKTLRDGGAFAKGLLNEIRSVARDVEGRESAALKALGARLGSAAAALGGAIDWLLERGEDDPRAAYAGAVPYLEAWGLVCGGWMLAHCALAAERLLADGHSDRRFLEGKLAGCLFYAEHLLVRVPPLAGAIVNGALPVLAFDDNQW
jgi:alkylation response protein AidB-like acyl-CoA dehydrogenase